MHASVCLDDLKRAQDHLNSFLATKNQNTSLSLHVFNCVFAFPIFFHATALLAEYNTMLARPAAPPTPMPVFCKHCCNADSSYISLKSLKIVFRKKINLNPFKKCFLKCLSIAKHACQGMFRRFLNVSETILIHFQRHNFRTQN